MKIEKVAVLAGMASIWCLSLFGHAQKVPERELLEHPRLVLSQQAFERRIAGAILYTFNVDSDGRVTEANLFASSLSCPNSSNATKISCREAFDTVYEAGLNAVKAMSFRTNAPFRGVQQYNISFVECHDPDMLSAPSLTLPFPSHSGDRRLYSAVANVTGRIACSEDESAPGSIGGLA